MESVQDLRNLLDSAGSSSADALVFQSSKMLQVIEQVERFARSSGTVLLSGESGTGKELVAQHIHTSSGRCDQRYVRVNCAALPDSLTESELFGHERGAFTGAVADRAGRFEWADGGTLLLDEISEVSLAVQAKLLRVLEGQEIQRVGSNTTATVDVRVIATTNRQLEREVEEGRFRDDLYHRINVFQTHLPPLRDRREDIPRLSQYFLGKYQHESSSNASRIAPDALERLIAYDWPGNVRQLRNAIHRACVLARSETISLEDLPPLTTDSTEVPEEFLSLSLAEIERRVILKCLDRFGGNKTAAAKQLGITARSITNKLNAWQLRKAA